ncbi:hypothetical protein [uncultured Microbacterium sp.]|uniref:hypothetical protein n=1 Tax=uncultured Microbacterium sp. TaxID=191216 RepID=UPI002607C52B|nr:hypothetical protein [uncultured Microbacterium sp.]
MLVIFRSRRIGVGEVGEHVMQMFQRVVDAGQARKDCSIIVKLVDGTLQPTA